MARIFTTTFEFNHQKYDAIVTVITQNGNLNFNVKVLDTDLQHFLPGEISYTGTKGFEQLTNLNNTIAQSLMRSLSVSIEKHLVTG
jgi:hypothetical protein